MEKKFEVFSAINHNHDRTGADQLRDFTYRLQEKLFAEGEKKRASISSTEELESYNKEVRKQFLEGLGSIPLYDGPLDAKVTKVDDMGEYTMEQILFCVRPGAYATATLYIPKGLTEPSPAILFVCGHSPTGRMRDIYQIASRTLVQAGLIVFELDPMGQGERSNYYDRETGTYLINRAVPDHDAYGVPAFATGRSLECYFLSDEKRAIDYMCSRPEIDPNRIGMTGISGGGTQTSAMILYDDRLAAASPGTFLTTRREIMYTGMAQDSEQIWPGISRHGIDHANVLLMMAPRPINLLAAQYDYFPIEGTREIVDEAKRFYEMYGKGDSITLFEDRSIHTYSRKMAVSAAAFFTEVFYGERRVVDNSALEAFPEEFMYVTKTGQVLECVEGAKSVLEEVREYAAQLREKRAAFSDAERKAWLQKKVTQYREPVAFNPRFHNPGNNDAWVKADGYCAMGISWWTQRRLFSYGTLIRREKDETNDQLPTVIAIWRDGTKKIAEHEEWIRSKCDEGKQVLVLDVPGVGSIEQHLFLPTRSYKEAYGTLYRICYDLFYCDDSLAAMRSYDVLRCIEMLGEYFGIGESDVTLYCDDPEGTYGVTAGYLNGNVSMEYGEHLMKNFEKEILGQRALKYDDTLSIIIPGMLEYFDFEELMR